MATLHTQYSQNMTSIWHAAKSGDVNSLLQLIAEGGNINERGGKVGMSALTMAAFSDNFECVSILLDNKADVEAKDEDGINALYRFVESYVLREETLLHAESEQLIDISERMLIMGADPSIMFHGGSIMSMAIDIGVFKLVKLLVHYGIHPSSICNNSPTHTALSYAITRSRKENSLTLVQLLIDLGADLSIREGRQMPLYAAIHWVPVGPQNPEDMVRLLLDNGVFLSEEYTDPEQYTGMTYDEELSSRKNPIATVEWLTNYADDHEKSLSAALIASEPANRKRQSQWQKKVNKMKREAFNSVHIDRLKEKSSLKHLTPDMIREITKRIK